VAGIERREDGLRRTRRPLGKGMQDTRGAAAGHPPGLPLR
jgi:hypothetical protein